MTFLYKPSFHLGNKKVSQKLSVSLGRERERGVQESSEVGVNHAGGWSIGHRCQFFLFVILSPPPFLETKKNRPQKKTSLGPNQTTNIGPNWKRIKKKTLARFCFFSFCKKCEVGVNDAGRPGLGANSPKNSNLFIAA